MPHPQIDWNWQHLPRNSDEVEAVTHVQTIDGKEFMIFYNITRKEFIFIHDESYGKLVDSRLIDPEEDHNG